MDRRRVAAIRSSLLRWARSIDRPLPWRGETDPYRVLVSEVMLQQTQAGRVAGRYREFLAAFPTVDSLAASTPHDVLRAWGDLGYNRRALNLWRSARAIVESGSFPDTAETLQDLPGVGPYTACAVACFAFGEQSAVVEANIRRVLSRLGPASSGADVEAAAAALLPRGRAAEWNQALMDLGETICLPRRPRCDACPLRRVCAAARAPGGAPSPVRRRAAVRFSGTRRYARGRIVAVLREDDPSGMGRSRIARLTGLDRGRVADALAGLAADGVVHEARGRIRLGPDPVIARGRAVPARRSRGSAGPDG